MPPKTRSGSKSTNTGKEPKIDSVKMESKNNNKPKPTNPPGASDSDDSSTYSDDSDDKSLLKKIIKNQKKAEKKIKKRFSKLDATVSDTKQSLDSYIAENNKAISNIKDDVKSAFAKIETLQKDFQGLKDSLTKAQQDLDRTRNKVDIASKDLKEKSATIEKLDAKYTKDEELHKQCL